MKKEKKTGKLEQRTRRYNRGKRFNDILSDLVEIKTSNITGAGKGAFAKTLIQKGLKIGEYDGKILDITEYEKLKDKSYVFEVYKKYRGKYCLFYIDAKHGNLLKYVNGAHCGEQKKRVNIESYQYAERIFFKAIRDLTPGEELLIDYGDNYWED
jgi:SET domain-containing protein